MEFDFFAYIERMEYLAFFSGYPFLYALILVITQSVRSTLPSFKNAPVLLPYSYALSGTLYLGYMLDKLYPEITADGFIQLASHSWLTPWALSSLIFWIPVLARKIVISLLHSLVFMFLLISDIVQFYSSAQPNTEHIRNDMNMYGVSLLIQTAAFLVVFLSFQVVKRNRKPDIS